MKKTFLFALTALAMLVSSCGGAQKEGAENAVEEAVETPVETSVDTTAGSSDEAAVAADQMGAATNAIGQVSGAIPSAPKGQQAPQASQPKVAKPDLSNVDYTPTGDINKDAKDLVDAQLSIATREVDGTLTDAERNRVSAMLYIASAYYTKNNKIDAFKKALGEQMKSGIETLSKNKK